jgi:hypothetical protein
MLVSLDGAVHGLPVGPGLPNLQNFWARKMYNAINTLVVANDQRLILACDQRWASFPPEVTVKSLPLPTNLKIVMVTLFSLPA